MYLEAFDQLIDTLECSERCFPVLMVNRFGSCTSRASNKETIVFYHPDQASQAKEHYNLSFEVVGLNDNGQSRGSACAFKRSQRVSLQKASVSLPLKTYRYSGLEQTSSVQTTNSRHYV